MKSRISQTLLFLCFITQINAQKLLDKNLWFVSIGSSYYIGDLAGLNKQYSNMVKQPRLAGEMGYRRKLVNNLSLNGLAFYQQIFSDDNILNKELKNNTEINNFTRGLHFKNNLIGFTFSANYHPIYQTRKQKKDLYFGAGVSGFYSNPKALNGNTWVDLRPLEINKNSVQTIRNYNKYNLGVPFLIGASYKIKDSNSLGIEIKWTFTFTDYLDDVSGNSLEPSSISPLALQLADRSQESLSAYSKIDRKNGVNLYNQQRGGSFQANPFTTKIKGFGELGDFRGNKIRFDSFYHISIKWAFSKNKINDCPVYD